MDINVRNARYNCNAIDGYLGGDRNHNRRNACHNFDGSRSLIEGPGRNQTSEEVPLSFQTSAVRGHHSTLLPERGYSGMNSYETGESSRDTGFLDRSYGTVPICKYYVQGRCQNAQKCRFLHYSAYPSQMRHDPVAMDTNHTFYSDGREKSGSKGICTSDVPYGHNDYPLKDPRRNKCSRFPLENFDSQEEALTKEVALSNSLVLSSIHRRADSNNGAKDHIIPATTGNLNVQTGLRAAILTAEKQSGHIAQIQGTMHQTHGVSKSGDGYKNIQLQYPEMNQYKGPPLVDFGSQNNHEACSEWPQFLSSIRTRTDSINSEQFMTTHARNSNLSRKTEIHSAAPTAPWNTGHVAGSPETICTHLPAVTTPWPSNGQVHKNEFSVHQKTQGDFAVPQPHVNNSVLSLQGQPVLRAHASPDLSSRDGQRFEFVGEILKNLISCSQSKEISKQVQDTGVQSMQMQSIWNLQPAGLNVQCQHQTSPIFSVLPHKRSADMVGARIDHNTGCSEDACINPNFAPNNSKVPLTAGPVRKQSCKRNHDRRLATSLSAAASSVPIPPNQQGVVVQRETSVLSGRKVHTLETAIDSNDNSEILSHLVTLSAGNTIVNPSEGNKGESSTVQAKEYDNKQVNEHKMFRNALINFAKEELREAWHGGRLTRELYKVIVGKVVEKIMTSEKNIPKTKQRIRSYLKSYKRKMFQLVQG